MSGEDCYLPATDAAAGGTDATSSIEQDTPCRRCGYNLRGLSADGRCPECGTPVGFSLKGDLLRFCDPAWVDTLRRGVKCIVMAVVLGIFGIAVAFAVGLGASSSNAGIAIGGGTLVVAMILSAVGWWLLTQPDPSGLGEDQYGTARKLIRVSQVVGLLQIALGGLMSAMTFDDATMMAFQAVMVVAIFVGVMGIFAECSYLDRLARRIPDDRLSSRAHFLMWALGCTYGATQLLMTAVGLVGGRSSATQGFTCFTSILQLFVLIFYVMLLLLLEKMGKRFKQEALVARQTWAAAPFVPTTTPADGLAQG
jgi:hypothetical protein